MEAPRQRDVADYETLRGAALLSGLSHGCALLPCGLAAWLTAVSPLPQQRLPSEASQSAEASHHGSLPAAFASIVLRLTQEAAAHA